MIGVIGAGPAGLACAALIRRSGEQVVVLERGEIGAAWETRYDRLHLHTVRWLSSLPGYPIPRSFGKWPSRDRVVEYLHAYAERNGLDVRTGIAVERVAREDDGWVARTGFADVHVQRVVVATGYSNVPFVPDWPGEFSGDVIHSFAYRNPEPYRGKRVLVVGTGNSGAEIAVDLADGGAKEVLLAVRTPPSIVRRDTLGIPSQLLGIATGHLPVGIVDRLASTLRRLAVPDLAPYGLPAPARPYSDFLRRGVLPILDVGLVDAVRRGRVHVVRAVEGFADGAVALAGDNPVHVDAVIAATGFRTGLQPLVGHLGVLDEEGVPLVHGAAEHADAPGLHFVGYRMTLAGMLRVIGGQARDLARAIGERPELDGARMATEA